MHASAQASLDHPHSEEEYIDLATPPADEAADESSASVGHGPRSPLFDEEAEIIEQLARDHASSASESKEDPPDEQAGLHTFDASGPFGCIHAPTQDSLEQYILALPSMGMLATGKLRARCGAHLGPALFVISCKEPINICRRRACLLATADF